MFRQSLGHYGVQNDHGDVLEVRSIIPDPSSPDEIQGDGNLYVDEGAELRDDEVHEELPDSRVEAESQDAHHHLPGQGRAAQASSVSGRKETASARSGRRSVMFALSTLKWDDDSGLDFDDSTHLSRKRRDLKIWHDRAFTVPNTRIIQGWISHPLTQEHFQA